jgi:hypothetical protein
MNIIVISSVHSLRCLRRRKLSYESSLVPTAPREPGRICFSDWSNEMPNSYITRSVRTAPLSPHARVRRPLQSKKSRAPKPF